MDRQTKVATCFDATTCAAVALISNLSKFTESSLPVGDAH